MTSYPRELRRAFEDADVAQNYRYRQPYPSEVFAVLEGLLVEPQTILDVGCGTGALTIRMARFADRVDAVDPSAAMLREARRQPGGDSERIRWILGTAEDATLEPPYGLITAGASIHWMEPERVMPRCGGALAPAGRLAIVDSESIYDEAPWRREILAVIQRHSALAHHDDFSAVVHGLESTGHFAREGEVRTLPVPYEHSVDDYMAMLASTSSLSRATLGTRAEDFTREARAVFARYGMERVRGEFVAFVVWGRPL